MSNRHYTDLLQIAETHQIDITDNVLKTFLKTSKIADIKREDNTKNKKSNSLMKIAKLFESRCVNDLIKRCHRTNTSSCLRYKLDDSSDCQLTDEEKHNEDIEKSIDYFIQLETLKCARLLSKDCISSNETFCRNSEKSNR